MENVQLLKRIPLFAEFKITELMNVSMVAQTVNYPAGELIFRENAKGDALYVIKQGEVKVTKNDSFGEAHVLAYLGVGEYFGEISLIDNAPRSASAYAGTDAVLLKIKHKDFKNLITGDREIERKFYKSFTGVLCERLRVANENLTFSREINRMIREIDGAAGSKGPASPSA